MDTSIPLSLLLLRHISEIRLRLTPLPAGTGGIRAGAQPVARLHVRRRLENALGRRRQRAEAVGINRFERAAGRPALLCERGQAGMARSKRFAARPHRRPPQKLVDSDKLALAFLPFSCYNGQTGGKNGKYALSKTRAVGARRKQTMKKCVAVLLAVGMAAALCAWRRDAGSPSAPAESSQTISEEVSEEVREETSSPAADTNARVPCLRTP